MFHKTKSLFAATALAAFTLLPAHARQDTPDSLYVETVARLVEAASMDQTLQRAAESLYRTMRETSQEDEQAVRISETEWEEIGQQMQRQLLILTARHSTPAFARYLDQQELEALVAWCELPAGRLFWEVMPQMAREEEFQRIVQPGFEERDRMIEWLAETRPELFPSLAEELKAWAARETEEENDG